MAQASQTIKNTLHIVYAPEAHLKSSSHCILIGE